MGGTGGAELTPAQDAREERAPLQDPSLKERKKRRASGRSDHPAVPKAASKNPDDVFEWM
ncbi:hypothetical protein MAE02_10820 [Microvirga aerophila]|uniref:Uncharacterized protein n=1 Tax=Microvirga aerophila TaxID=670291 RepID=A0A512BN46_9HYPH|nr:hypothetical protein MAE02_10820 [Microvirga aerophila]